MSLLSTTKPLLLIVALAIMPAAVRADVIFSSGTQGGGGAIVAGPSSPYAWVDTAATFVPGKNYILTGASAALNGSRYAIGGLVDFAVYSDNVGVPGNLLSDLGSVNVLASTTFSTYAAPGPPKPGITLFSGVTYWLVLSPGTDSTAASWGGDLGNIRTSQAQYWDYAWHGGLFPTGVAFSVEGTPTGASAVPEPVTALLCLPVLGLIGFVQRKRS